MALQAIKDSIYISPGGANLGLVAGPDGAVAIDAGQDKDAAKRLVNAASEAGIKITTLFITHAHADHFGGAGYLRERTGCHIITSRYEAAIVANPVIEPLYLFAGAKPVKELTGKFFMGKPAEVDGVVCEGVLAVAGLELRAVGLPGHSPGQMGLACQGVLFAGDTVFPRDVLVKYRIPFYTDIDQAAATCRALLDDPPEILVSGHGPVCRDGEIADLVKANLDAIGEVRDRTWELLQEPRSTAEVLAGLMDGWGLTLNSIGQQCLAFTTVQATCASLVEAGEAVPDFAGNVLRWRRA